MKTLTIFLASAVCVLAQTFQTQRVHLGDSPTFTLPLTWQGNAFAAGTDWALIWTAKTKPADTDAQAIIQKTSGAGITASGNNAVVTLVRPDTLNLTEGALVWDVQAQHAISGEVRTVARGRLILERDVTRQTTTSIPVVTTVPPLPFGGGASLLGENVFQAINTFSADTYFSGTIFTGVGIQSVGTISATGFQGSGSLLSDVPATSLTGDVPRARINSALSANAAPVVVTTLSGSEVGTPAAPAVNGWVIYADDSGGKTRLMVRFASGAVQQISIQP